MKTVWTDTNGDRAAVSLSRSEIDMIRQALDSEETQLTCMAALNNVEVDEDDYSLEEQADFAGDLKRRFDDIIQYMDDEEDSSEEDYDEEKMGF